MHLREDRRHIRDDDVRRVKETCHVRLNLEMAATREMVDIACGIKPQLAMLVPEGRAEVTTEGGLDVAGQITRLKDIVSRLRDHGMIVSAFIDAVPAQIDAAAIAGFQVCEVHTGPYANAFHEGGDWQAELKTIAEAGRLILEGGMRFNAGHALNYVNVQPVSMLVGHLGELHIGHAIVSRAIFTGLRDAVRDMKQLLA